MTLSPVSSTASFLRSAFGLASLQSYGLNFGTRLEAGPASRPLLADRDGAWFFFEEMAQAASQLVSADGIPMKPLEDTALPVDLSRRLYLDEFKVLRSRTGRFSTLLGATEYRHFAPMKCLGEGASVLINGIQNGARPERLSLRCAHASAGHRVQWSESLGYARNDPDGDFSEISIFLRRNDFLRRAFGFREKNSQPALPWEADADTAQEYLTLALQLTGQIFLSDPISLKEGFMLMALDEPDLSVHRFPVQPVNHWHLLSFDALGRPRLMDHGEKPVDPEGLVLDSPSYVILSMLTQEAGGRRRPALSVGWSAERGFHVEQRRRIFSGGLSVFPAVSELIDASLAQIDADLASFERLPAFDQLGWLGAYYSLLADEKHADC